MKHNAKNIAVTVCFSLLLVGLMIANFALPDTEISLSERRKLKQLPTFSWSELEDGGLFSDFETYLQDQFVLRDELRGLKAFTRLRLMLQMDNNGIFLIGDDIFKLEYKLDEGAVSYAADKINSVCATYGLFDGHTVAFALIPDKNYYSAAQNGYLTLDYVKLQQLLETGLSDKIVRVDLTDTLSADSYYRTDLHWKQSEILGTADRLLAALGNEASPVKYTAHALTPFRGSYYGQAALGVKPDELVYLSSDTIDGCTVYNYETKAETGVYVTEKFDGTDPYDVYLSGAVTLLEITNPACTNGKELVIFRDSFGSSIAPLLIESYEKITLVDLRYISSQLLGDYIDFSAGQDVLFLYSASVLNSGRVLK